MPETISTEGDEMTISTSCDNCRYLTGHRCKLWQVAVKDPADAHCESWQNIATQETKEKQS